MFRHPFAFFLPVFRLIVTKEGHYILSLCTIISPYIRHPMVLFEGLFISYHVQVICYLDLEKIVCAVFLKYLGDVI